MGNFFYRLPEQTAVVDVLAQKKQEEEKVIAKTIQVEKITNQLDDNIHTFQNKQAKYEAKIGNLKKKAKLLLEQDKKKEAKKVLQQVARLQKHLDDIELRRKVIVRKKDQLEMHQMDKQAVNALEAANEQAIDDKLMQRLQEQIITMKENKAIQELINNQFESMAEDDQANEAADEMFKDLQKQVNKDKISDSSLLKRQVYVNIGKNNVEKEKSKNRIEYSLEDL